ncbi:MAG: PEP-CTERM sorting domain-containing protein [Phycisphaerae bacterium]|nr:PEP-CTERM sorting domain-containing protein [Phycisphaerae bacterium]
MKQRTIIIPVLLVSLLLASTSSYGDGFVWDAAGSTYQKSNEIFYRWFYDLDLTPTELALSGLSTTEGYGTTALDGRGAAAVFPFNGDTTAYGGAAPANLAAQGINERPGHYYFGFAHTYPNTDDFSAYELGNTPLDAGTYMNLRFRRIKNANDEYDPINFIGVCGDTVGFAEIYERESGNDQYIYIALKTLDPVYSTKGAGDQDAVFGLYINYGRYDEDNENVDYDGALFRTNIHWWDIDVPEISQDKLASIQLSTQASTDATVVATVPNSFFDSIGVDPNNVRGYVDEDEIPMGQDAREGYSFEKVIPKGELEYGLYGDEVTLESSEFVIHNDNWSTHDIGVGQIPEPATLSLLAIGGLALLRRKRK